MSAVIHLINDIEPKNGGAQNLVRNLFDGFNKNNLNIELYSVLTIHNRLDNARSLEANSIYSFKAFFKVCELLRKTDNATIFHVHLFPTIFYVALCKLLFRSNQTVYFTEHSTSNRRRGSFLGSIIDWFIYRSVDKVIAISDGTKAELLKWQPQLVNRTIVINNGIDLKHSELQIRKIKSPVKILSVGRLTEAKNYLNIIAAINEIKDVEVIYHIAGDGEMRPQIQELILKENLESKVKLLGFVDDVSLLMKKYDMFLQASLWEGFGLSIVEAMNEGLPLIVSNIPGINEVVGQYAVYVDPKDPSDIALQIQNLIRSKDKLMNNAQHAFKRSLQFDIKDTVNKYQDLY